MNSPTADTEARTADLERELLRRRRAEEMLRQSEERLRVLLERGGDIVYRLCLQPLAFEYLSPAVTQISGYGATEFYARPELIFDIVHADDRPLLTEYLEAGDFARPIALRVLRRDGEVIWLEHLALPAYDAQGHLVQVEGIVREVTAYGKVLEGLDHRFVSVEERERLMSALRRIGSATLGSLELDHVVDTLAEQVVRAGILRSLMVALVDHEGGTVRVVRNYLSFDGHYEQGIGQVRPGAHLVPSPTVAHREGDRLIFTDRRIIGTTYDLEDDNITPTVARTGVLTVIDGADPRFDKRFEPSCDRREGTTSYFIPIRRDGRVLAVLGTGSRRSRKAETLQRLDAMEPLLEQAAIALDHALIHRRVRDTARELHDLNSRLRDEVSRRLQAEAALRDFSSRNVQLAEEERRRVARELHDGVNQLLCAAGFGLESAMSQAPSDGPLVHSLEQTRSLLDRTIREVRRISQDLRPGVLDDLGLAAAIRSLCDEFTQRTGIAVRHDVSRLPEAVPPGIGISLYRLLQEALNQAPRPRDGTAVTLSAHLDAGGQLRAAVVVETTTTDPWSDAIDHLRERAGLLGGSVEVLGEPSARLAIQLPAHLDTGASP